MKNKLLKYLAFIFIFIVFVSIFIVIITGLYYMILIIIPIYTVLGGIAYYIKFKIKGYKENKLKALFSQIVSNRYYTLHSVSIDGTVVVDLLKSIETFPGNVVLQLIENNTKRVIPIIIPKSWCENFTENKAFIKRKIDQDLNDNS